MMILNIWKLQKITMQRLDTKQRIPLSSDIKHISPKYAEIFYQNRIVHRCPANCNIRSPHGEFLFEAVPDRKWFCAQFFLRTEPFCVLP